MQDFTLVKSNLRGYELGYIMTQEIKQRIEQLRLNKTPDGYKKTAVGVIPQDWEVINLSDISEYKTKKNVENIKYPTFTNSATMETKFLPEPEKSAQKKQNYTQKLNLKNIE